jgi:hypothetical protein
VAKRHNTDYESLREKHVASGVVGKTRLCEGKHRTKSGRRHLKKVDPLSGRFRSLGICTTL